MHTSLYFPLDSSFISTQFLVLNLEVLFGESSNRFVIFWYSIIILLYYINLNSSIIFCLSCGDIYLSFGISLLTSFECGFLNLEKVRGSQGKVCKLIVSNHEISDPQLIEHEIFFSTKVFSKTT